MTKFARSLLRGLRRYWIDSENFPGNLPVEQYACVSRKSENIGVGVVNSSWPDPYVQSGNEAYHSF